MYFIKPVEELRFTDDFMFSYVMRNKDICREVIRRLLKIEAREIKFPEAQKTIAPIYSGKGIRLVRSMTRCAIFQSRRRQ